MMEKENNQTNTDITPKPCPKECAKCSPWQQVYCCTKMMFDLSGSVKKLTEDNAAIRSELAELRSLLPAKSDDLSNPVTTE